MTEAGLFVRRAVPGLQLQLRPVQQLQIQADGLLYLADKDELVRRVRARALAGAHLHGGEGHQRLVGQRGRAEGRAAQGHGAAHQRMPGRHVRRAQAERTRLRLAADVLLDFLEQFFVGVALVAADVHDERAAVGDDVVLRAGADHRHAHLHRAQQGRDALEAVVAEPGDVFQYLIDGVVALVAGGVAGAAGGGDVQHHQPLLGDGGLHLRRLAHEGEADGRQLGQDALDALAAGHFFFARSQVDEIVALRRAAQREERLQQADHAGARVVAAQAVELAVGFELGREGVFAPALHGLHGVDVRVEQQRGPLQVEAGAEAPDVVALAARLHALLLDVLLQAVGGTLLVAADGGNAYQ